MGTNRTKQRLGVETSKKSVNSDTFLKINLDGKERLLPPDEINKVINIGDRFNVERQRSKFYRILGTINPTVSNALFNLNDNILTDKYTWAGFNDVSFLETSYAQAIKTHLKEINGWFGYTDPDKMKSGLCDYIEMEPKAIRFSFVPDVTPFHSSTNVLPIKNWELTITYPKETNKTHNMVNGGLLIIEQEQAIVSTRTMTAFGMACRHNLSIGDIIKITGTVGYDGEHVVVRTGLDNGDLKEYYFVIDIPSGLISVNSRVKRMFGGVESEYYFRIFRKIKTRNAPVIETDDYETYKLAFSENAYADDIVQYVFNEDIDVTDLTDNLGRPISELYLTVIKTDSNGLFTKVSSGIETPFIPELNSSNINTYLLDVPVINKIHNGSSSHIPLESSVSINNNNLTPNNNDFYGDLVEYNINEVKETVLAEVAHRFNTVNREIPALFTYVKLLDTPTILETINLGPRQEGYFYKAHHLIKIREFSSYVEQGDSQTEGVPDYAISLGGGRYIWRDMLEIGFNESNEKTLDYPFLNGCNYMYQNHCFYVRRQDPFDNWGLYHSDFPNDPIGEDITDNYDVNEEDNVC